MWLWRMIHNQVYWDARVKWQCFVFRVMRQSEERCTDINHGSSWVCFIQQMGNCAILQQDHYPGDSELTDTTTKLPRGIVNGTTTSRRWSGRTPEGPGGKQYPTNISLTHRIKQTQIILLRLLMVSSSLYVSHMFVTRVSLVFRVVLL